MCVCVKPVLNYLLIRKHTLFHFLANYKFFMLIMVFNLGNTVLPILIFIMSAYP